eukprot:CAMPEP_0197924270 /NCGR_PEP_ID=MMETSP1439-20131203/95417_1 /TAXON_ID=66791 /ORGANISM="Gonyaulax spinifera, Strain CCMP409" /LENGTH=56 /DNA_ID=CAMNT_0043546685 /DNA_START=121 /DNA_END=287 /DNA_ORIENTATION=-
MKEFWPTDLANLAWAGAKLTFLDGPLFDSISAAAITKMSAFKARDIGNTAWALSTR